ncbi:hypothetical protein DRW03_14215 [Corallococcus sp. H22C18031201]|nr:hypothetical protein DRW03_14215 [Corallococcus sp. H22C18031201]
MLRDITHRRRIALGTKRFARQRSVANTSPRPGQRSERGRLRSVNDKAAFCATRSSGRRIRSPSNTLLLSARRRRCVLGAFCLRHVRAREHRRSSTFVGSLPRGHRSARRLRIHTSGHRCIRRGRALANLMRRGSRGHAQRTGLAPNRPRGLHAFRGSHLRRQLTEHRKQDARLPLVALRQEATNVSGDIRRLPALEFVEEEVDVGQFGLQDGPGPCTHA